VRRFIITALHCRVCFVVENKSKRMRWAGHVIFMKEKAYTHRTLHVNSVKGDRDKMKK
jgi:hypothetical protein